MVRLCVHCNARPFISLCVHSLVFPERTFYLCTKTGVEADEWIKILRWKLVSVFRLRYGIFLPEAQTGSPSLFTHCMSQGLHSKLILIINRLIAQSRLYYQRAFWGMREWSVEAETMTRQV